MDIDDEWRKYAVDNNFIFLVIMKDLEDKTLYPMYFKDEISIQRHKDCLISESKAEIVEIISL